jgi:hypothetical protein
MRRQLAFALTLALVVSTPTAFSATPKVGGACAKINQFYESKSTLLVCALAKGKKTWRKTTSVEKSLYLKEKNRLANAAGDADAKVLPTPPPIKVYKIGDFGPGGGIVFYVSPQVFASPGSNCGTNCRYFEVTTADIPGVHAWCSNNNGFIGASESRIGMGMSNTSKADLVCTSGAIQVAADYSQNNINDWHLPSKDELSLLSNISASVGVFQTDLYYSSTEASSWHAWSQIMRSNGTQYSFQKLHTSWVRPVRAF